MAEIMREIGRVKQVQIQRSSLKIGEKSARVYNPSPLLVVDCISVNSYGVTGLMADGAQIIDVHNAQHPTTKNSGVNGASVSFTGHYREIRAQYGTYLVDGCAGENILIEADRKFTLADLGVRLAFENAQTGEVAYLDDLMVAAPCVEFSHYVQKANQESAPLAADQLKATLQFLNDGRRGFYATAFNTATIQAGDRVFTVKIEGK
jgi:hypothetical protein